MVNKIKNLSRKPSPYKKTLILCDPDVKSYLERLRKRFVGITIDKSVKNFAFICKRYCTSTLLAEVGLSNSKCKKYSKAPHSTKEIIQGNINYCKKFDLNITELVMYLLRTLLIMYWLPKIHKTSTGARFIVTSKICNTKPLPDTMSKILKIISNTVESLHNKSFF